MMNRKPATRYPREKQYQGIAKAKLLIDTQYPLKLPLHVLCKEAAMSKFHFIRRFKNIYGVSPLQYLINVRITAAKTLIESGIPAASACWEVGFESVSSFMVLFKEKTGRSSSLYRNERRQYATLLSQKPSMVIPSCLTLMHKQKKQ